MFSWMSKDESRAKHGDIYEGVAEGLKGIYKYVELDHMSQVIIVIWGIGHFSGRSPL